MFDTVIGVNMSSDGQFSTDVAVKVEFKTEDEFDSKDDSNEGELVVDIQDDPSTLSGVDVKKEIGTIDDEVEVIESSKWCAEQVTIKEETVCQMCTQYRNKLEDLMKDETKSEEFKMVCKKFEEHRADTRTCDEKTFTCPICGRKFFWFKQLKRHKIMAHKHFKCKLCPRKFSDESRLRTHQKFKHRLLLVYNCESCDQAFFKARDLYQHEKIHSEERRNKKSLFKCSICQKGFTKLDQYQSHRCYTYACDLCKRRFHCDENFESHKCDDLKPYQCQFCKKSFVIVGKLKAHEQRCRLKENKKDKSVECQTCNKSFKNLKALIMHKRSHMGSKECPVCKKSFTSKKTLKLHELSHKAIECFNLGSLNL